MVNSQTWIISIKPVMHVKVTLRERVRKKITSPLLLALLDINIF